ncbi:hypothetical protein GCM10023333_41040 [Ferrimonas pelagia]|uniref:YgjV family protein n=2 Tax=Ferrimonas pelagia TaxID=1177826 RepID=A0ABP9FKA3_9GAMM
MAVGWWANGRSCDRQLLRGNMLAASLTAIHLGLLGSVLGMTNQWVNAGRFAIAQRTRSWLMAGGFALLSLAQGLAFAQHWSEWCVVFAAMISSALVFRSQGTQLRAGLILCNLLNLTLSITLLSWSGIAYQVMTVLMLTRVLWQQRVQPAVPA